MNQARIWCVVSPSVGLPLFLGSVAAISFTVHFAVLNNTPWVKDFFSGSARTAQHAAAAPATHVAARENADYQIDVSPAAADGSVTVVLTPKKPLAELKAEVVKRTEPAG